MATTGVTGGRWRADVSATGTIEPWDGSAPLAWYIAADDRWHNPATDTGVRQSRVEGTAVIETRVRIPGGDAVQRVWSVPDGGGVTLVEVHNDSSLPIACAFSRSDLLTTRPPTDVPIQGIAVPADSIVVPIGHRTTVTVGLAHRAPAAGRLPAGLPDADAVARGWVGRTEAASRLDLPDATLVEAVRAARCEVALGVLPEASVDPERFLLGLCELVRMNELTPADCAAVVDEVAAAAAAVARSRSLLAAAALRAAGVVLDRAGERRAVKDVQRITVEASNGLLPMSQAGAVADVAAAADVAHVAAVEGRLAAGAHLLPHGIAKSWKGQPVEAHGLVAGPASRLSLALRWHGPNVAVLWEVTGTPVTLTSGVVAGWTSAAPSGEALWVN